PGGGARAGRTGVVSTLVTQVAAAAAAILVFATIFLPWLSVDGVTEASEQGTDVPVQFLWDTIPASDDPSLVVVLGPIAVLLLVAALVPSLRVLALLGGVLAIDTAVLFVIQTDDLLTQGRFDASFLEGVGIG